MIAAKTKSASVNSTGEPGRVPPPGKIKIRFAPVEPVTFQIKHRMKTPIQNNPLHPALFQVAALMENQIPATPRFFESTPDLTWTALAGLKLEAAKSNSNAARTKTSPGTPRRGAGRSLTGPRLAEFHLCAPQAKSVKLAADFTEWDKFPLDLIKSDDGVWRASVPLPPGHHSYRFIIDGQWCDDPHCARRAYHEFFGTAIAEVEVE